jgi:hypothetical protein
MTKEVYTTNQEKAKTGEATDEKIFNELEENAESLFGNQGTWFQNLHPSLKSAYGTFGAYGYIICLVSELMRFSRNIFAHAGQNPKAMEQTLGTRKPSNEQIFNYFAARFPLFYLHILYIYRKATLSLEEFNDDAYLAEFKKYANSQSQLKMDSGDLVSLQKTNSVEGEFHDQGDNVKRNYY